MKKPRILFVEDEEDLLFVLQQRLEWEGYEVTPAMNLKAGREALRAGAPGVLLLDLMLPDGDGMDLLREIRTDPKLNNLPVIVMTGKGDDESFRQATELGATAYLKKPVSTETLLETIKVSGAALR